MQRKHLYFIIYFVIILTFAVSTEQISLNTEGSHTYYIKMADKPLSVKASPFCYRFMYPLIVSAFPVDTKNAYLITSFLLIVGIIWLLHYFLNILTNNLTLAFIGTSLIIITFWSVRYSIFNPYNVMLASYLAILLNLKLIFTKKNTLFLILFSISVFIHESVLILFPVYIMYQLKEKSFKKAIKPILLYGLPPFLLYILFRLFSFYGHRGSDIIDLINYYAAARGFSGYIKIFTKGIINAYSVIFIFILTDIKTLFKEIKKKPWTIVLFVFSLLLPFLDAGAETLLFCSFPAVITWFLAVWRNIQSTYNIRNRYLYIFTAILLIIFNLKFQEYGVIIPNFIKPVINTAAMYMVYPLLFTAAAHSVIIYRKQKKADNL